MNKSLVVLHKYCCCGNLNNPQVRKVSKQNPRTRIIQTQHKHKTKTKTKEEEKQWEREREREREVHGVCRGVHGRNGVWRRCAHPGWVWWDPKAPSLRFLPRSPFYFSLSFFLNPSTHCLDRSSVFSCFLLLLEFGKNNCFIFLWKRLERIMGVS